MAQLNVLGEFLRSRRGRLRPADVGLPAGVGRRRTPGLRREELATLAGVSVDYYTRLEQGKERNPGVAVLEAVGDALHLDRDERHHLRVLAAVTSGRSPAGPLGNASLDNASLGDDVHALLERLRPWPALVLSRVSHVLDANVEGLALFDGLADWPAARRNTVRYVFLHPQAPSLLGDWDSSARGGVANLRNQLAADPAAPDLLALHQELSAASVAFTTLWDQHDVRPRRQATKVFHHPGVGSVTLRHSTLRLQDDSARLSIYQATPGSPDNDALHLLAADQQLGQPT